MTPHWSRTSERGTLLGLRLMAWMHRVLGRRCIRLLMYPVVVYFFLTGRMARRASRDYLERLYRHAGALPGLSEKPTWRHVFRHFMAFAESMLDRISAWSDSRHVPDYVFPERAFFEKKLVPGAGAILIGAHLGSLDVARSIPGRERGINAVMHLGVHARNFMMLMKRLNPEYGVDVIAVDDLGPDAAIRLQEKLDAGEFLFILGDRTAPSGQERVCPVPFLGATALFPQGPFLMASLLKCPVYLFFSIRDGDHYRITLEPFAERIEIPRKDRSAALYPWIAKYAERLEAQCRLSPFQWFNFFDFWHSAPMESSIHVPR